MRFTLSLIAAATAVMYFTPATTYAQAYPNKTVRMIVPFPPSGGVDFVARVVGQKLTERLGQ